MDKSDRDWINANLSEATAPEGQDFDFEMWLSTDGKHTITVKGKIAQWQGASRFAQQVFDRLTQRYGSKTVFTAKEATKAAEVTGSGLKCAFCGAPATEKSGVSKAGKPYHGIFCSTEIKEHTKWVR